MWLLFLLLFLHFVFDSSAQQNCSDGVEVFSRFPGQSLNESTIQSSGVLLQEPGTSITLDCIKLCQDLPSCSFIDLDYTNSKCTSFIESDLKRLKPSSGFSFFQKECYQNITKESFQSLCGRRSWTFDVIIDASLEGFVSSSISNVETRADCEEHCLKSEDFECKSGNYFPEKKECQMSRETRRSQPQGFRIGFNSSIYIENECIPPRPSQCRYHKTQDVKLLAIDSLLYAKDDSDCQNKCNFNMNFICRSYSFQDTKCHLSSDDTFTRQPSDLVSVINSTQGDVVCPSDDCIRGVWTYEVSPDHTLSGSDQTPFDHDESSNFSDNSNDCRKECDRKGFLCPSFIINHHKKYDINNIEQYNQQYAHCFNLDRNSQGRSLHLIPSKDVTYFEKVCLKLPPDFSCKSKLWSFTRIPSYQLDMDKYHVTLQLITSRRDCEQKCLDSNCSSALYDEMSVTCKLSNETRFTSRFNRNFNPKISYLENNCFESNKSTCEWKRTPSAISQIRDMVIMNVTDAESCQKLCSETNRFQCRSYSYNSFSEKCILSSETRKVPLYYSPSSNGSNWTFYESKCDGDQSTVTESSNTVTQTEPILPVTSQLPLNYSICRSDQEAIFERIPGFEPFGNILLTRLCYGTVDNPGIVKSCRNLCLNQYSCKGFIIDYSRKHCIGVISPSRIERHSLRVAEEKDFFRLDCLPRILSCPHKLWSFERVIDQTVNPMYPPRYILGYISRSACQYLCLEERKFTCRSIVHEERGNVCKMYDRDRGGSSISDSSSFSLMFSQGSEYLENSCSHDIRMTIHQVCRYSIHRDDATIRSLIHSLQVISVGECRRACDTESSFHCRSFSFVDRMLYSTLNTKNLCLLSSDNESTSREGSLRYSPRSFYYQRDCRNV